MIFRVWCAYLADRCGWWKVINADFLCMENGDWRPKTGQVPLFDTARWDFTPEDLNLFFRMLMDAYVLSSFLLSLYACFSHLLLQPDTKWPPL